MFRSGRTVRRDGIERTALTTIYYLLQQGVIVRPIGDRTIVFCPPLVTTDDQIDRIIDTLATAVSSDQS